MQASLRLGRIAGLVEQLSVEPAGDRTRAAEPEGIIEVVTKLQAYEPRIFQHSFAAEFELISLRRKCGSPCLEPRDPGNLFRKAPISCPGRTIDP